MRQILSLLLLLPPALAAQTPARVAGPLSGVVYDRTGRALRPMVGVPGASYLGDAVVAGVDAAAVSPDGDLALVARDGRVDLVSGLRSLSPSAATLDGVAGDRFAWAPGGAWAAIHSTATSQARILRDPGANPSAGAVIDVPAGFTVLGVSDAGDLLAGSESGLFLLAAGSAPRIVAAIASPAAVAFRGADLFAASQTGISLVENFASSPGLSIFAEDAGIPVGLQVSSDGARLFAADSSGRVLRWYDIASRSAAGEVALDCTPSGLTAFGSRNVWLLNADATGGTPVYVATGSGAPAAWFVPAGRAE